MWIELFQSLALMVVALCNFAALYLFDKRIRRLEKIIYASHGESSAPNE